MKEMDFEEMRNQFAILKEQLNKQEIVSDRMLRETMKAKKNAINSTKKLSYLCAALCLVFYPLNTLVNAWSMPFSIATCLMIIFCAIATHYIHKPVDELNFMRDDFSTVARVMAKFKKQYDNWLHYVTPALLVPWLLWAFYDFVWKNAPDDASPKMLAVLALPLVIGFIIGGAIGYYYHCKAVNAAQDIIDDISE